MFHVPIVASSGVTDTFSEGSLSRVGGIHRVVRWLGGEFRSRLDR